jgi:hypothetical protein
MGRFATDSRKFAADDAGRDSQRSGPAIEEGWREAAGYGVKPRAAQRTVYPEGGPSAPRRGRSGRRLEERSAMHRKAWFRAPVVLLLLALAA